MTTPTREQVAFTAHLTHWDKSYPIRFDDFSAGYNAARSDLEATIAGQAKQIEEMAEAIRVKDEAIEDVIGWLQMDDIAQRRSADKASKALALQPSTDILAARDNRVAEAISQLCDRMQDARNENGYGCAEAIRAGERGMNVIQLRPEESLGNRLLDELREVVLHEKYDEVTLGALIGIIEMLKMEMFERNKT